MTQFSSGHASLPHRSRSRVLFAVLCVLVCAACAMYGAVYAMAPGGAPAQSGTVLAAVHGSLSLGGAASAWPVRSLLRV